MRPSVVGVECAVRRKVPVGPLLVACVWNVVGQWYLWSADWRSWQVCTVNSGGGHLRSGLLIAWSVRSEFD